MNTKTIKSKKSKTMNSEICMLGLLCLQFQQKLWNFDFWGDLYYSVFRLQPNMNAYNIILFLQINWIQISFGSLISAKYEFEYHYSISIIWKLFEQHQSFTSEGERRTPWKKGGFFEWKRGQKKVRAWRSATFTKV